MKLQKEDYRAIAKEIRARVSLVDEISSHVELKSAGSGFKACCPFHEDSTPSMTIDPGKGLYKCHGCPAGGDVITFHAEINGLTNGNAIISLARKYNIELPQSQAPAAASSSTEDLALLDRMSKWYHDQIKASEFASECALKEATRRGITSETLDKFMIGYGGARGRHPDFDRSQALRCGLVSQEKHWHYMTNRLVFPIRDENGVVCGFGGRRIADDGMAKYINTSETAYFKKQSLLYGLYEGRKAIRAKRQAIMVEGYMDVVIPHQAGVENVIGCMSASVSADTLSRLWQSVDDLVLCLDPDQAGEQGMLRIIKAAAQSFTDGKTIRIMTLEDGLDPDEFVLAYGASAFEERAKNAIPASTYLIRMHMKECDMFSPEGRAKFVGEVSGIAETFKRAPIFAAALRDQAILHSDLKAMASVIRACESEGHVLTGSLLTEIERLRGLAGNLLDRVEEQTGKRPRLS